MKIVLRNVFQWVIGGEFILGSTLSFVDSKSQALLGVGLACSRRSDSGVRAKKKASERAEKNEGRHRLGLAGP